MDLFAALEEITKAQRLIAAAFVCSKDFPGDRTPELIIAALADGGLTPPDILARQVKDYLATAVKRLEEETEDVAT